MAETQWGPSQLPGAGEGGTVALGGGGGGGAEPSAQPSPEVAALRFCHHPHLGSEEKRGTPHHPRPPRKGEQRLPPDALGGDRGGEADRDDAPHLSPGATTTPRTVAAAAAAGLLLLRFCSGLGE